MTCSSRKFLPALGALLLVVAALPARAIVLLDDEAPRPVKTADFRSGQLLPESAALGRVRALGATANWNAFGTVNSMIRHGGYVGTGYGSDAVAGARRWVRDNKVLFKLSDAGVDDLELVNDGRTPGNPGHAVLFRQTFGGLHVTHDGLITVGIVDGNVYYVSSSSAGDQPPAGGVSLSPLQGWLKATTGLGLNPGALQIKAQKDASATSGWHLLSVAGFNTTQRVRLAAIPMPNGGVRQAYEANVVNVINGAQIAYTMFVDAESGQILRRENRVNWQTAGIEVTPFNGMLDDTMDPACGPMHPFTLASEKKEILVNVVPGDASGALGNYSIDLYYGSTRVARYEFGIGVPNQLDYRPASGVIPAGEYSVQVCNTVPLPPNTYAGLITASESGVVDSATGPSPRWRWAPSALPTDFSDTDNRKLACWLPGPNCDFVFNNLASRYAWDILPSAGSVSTHTTIGNNAITAEAWGSPLTPAENYRPVATDRNYDFPHDNVWHSSKCNPSNLVPGGNDIDATIANLFVLHNRMHDWSYFLGFTETNYNLQVTNFGLTNQQRENDAEVGNAQAGAISGAPANPTFFQAPGRDNANQVTEQDGVTGITNQYLFQPLAAVLYGPCVDAAFDMGVVGHEYTHAISNRMIGGPDQNIGGDEGGAMGESWGDLDATEYQMANGYAPEGGASPTALGGYATGNLEIGIRNFSLDNNPLNYSNYGYDTSGVEVHSDGEIWNGTQWALRQALIADYQKDFPYEDRALQQQCADGKITANYCPGNRRWIQLIFDSFLLMPAAPTMLDARDAMLAADVARFGGANQKTLWRVFASRGMGRDAHTEAGGDGLTPTANFASPLQDNAEVSFTITGAESSAAIVAKVFVGDFSARCRPVADTDPATVVDATDEDTLKATSNTLDKASIVPGTYNFVVTAPGYGIHTFKSIALKAGANALHFTLPTNYASISNGATVTISASNSVNQDGKNNLIDDDEGSGGRFHDAKPVSDGYAIVALGGGAKQVSSVSVSTAAGPAPGGILTPDATINAGRFVGLRQFEIRTCSGSCTTPADFGTVAYTSADDAFKGVIPRPVQGDLLIRNFAFAPVMATHVMLKVLSNQCTGNPSYLGDQDNDPTVNTDCPAYTPPPYAVSAVSFALDGSLILPVAPSSVVRAAEFEVFGAQPKAELSSSGPTTPPTTPTVPVITSTPAASALSVGGGRFGGGALGVSLLLPLLAAGRRRRRAARGG